MGCCGSTEEAPVAELETVQQTEVEQGVSQVEQVKIDLNIAEAESLKAKPGTETFLATVLKAREEHSDKPEILIDACTRLQAHNRRLKTYVAVYDSEAISDALEKGNDHKLIAATCTRTKSQLQRTRQQYRDRFDKDLRTEVQSSAGFFETGYKKLMFFAIASETQYMVDIIDKATHSGVFGLGCNETALIELFVTHTQEQLQAGKKAWEDAHDSSLVDFINKELGHSYRHLNTLLQLLYMGERVETDAVDEELAAGQVESIHEECEKGWFEDFDESHIINIIGKNTTNQNALVADLFEKTYGSSLGKALKGKCGDRLHYALTALVQTKPDFLAMRLHDALDDTDKDILTRVMGGLDGQKMKGVAEAFERKYQQPLWSVLREKIDGDFLIAASTWINALNEPSRGAEKFTEVEVGDHGEDCEALGTMLDYLLLEHDSLLVFVAYLDVQVLREACVNSGTDDTTMIRTFATRNKRALARVNIGYREAYGEPLQQLIDRELLKEGGGWTGPSEKQIFYAYLAKLLVVQAEQTDSMILESSIGEGFVDHTALVEFLCGRNPKRVRAAKKKWEQRNDDSLVDKLSDHLSGAMRTVALRLLKGNRDTDVPVDHALARKLAHQLKDGNADYIEVLCDNSPEMNAEINKAFENAYDMSLRRAISEEYSGPEKRALTALISGPEEWYASQIKAALSGEEVDDKAVCRLIGAHDKDEMAKIAAAYDDKYGIQLKAAISGKIKGNYKRLAVAWVDLPDQLAQPEKLVDLPIPEPVEGDAEADVGKAYDDEISDEDSVMIARPDPAGPLYKAKLGVWEAKYQKYRDLGKKNKSDHYQRLIIWYPPAPPGHKLLRGYAQALEEEYKGGAHATEDWTTIWFETLSDEDFADGADKEAFKNWMDTTESMVAEKRVTPAEIKQHWGLDIPEPEPEKKYEEPAPMAVPVAPIAQPAVPVAAPVYQPPAIQPVIYQQPVIQQQVVYQQPQVVYQQPAPVVYQQPQTVYGQPQVYGSPYGAMYTPQPQIRVNYYQ